MEEGSQLIEREACSDADAKNKEHLEEDAVARLEVEHQGNQRVKAENARPTAQVLEKQRRLEQEETRTRNLEAVTSCRSVVQAAQAERAAAEVETTAAAEAKMWLDYEVALAVEAREEQEGVHATATDYEQSLDTQINALMVPLPDDSAVGNTTTDGASDAAASAAAAVAAEPIAPPPKKQSKAAAAAAAQLARLAAANPLLGSKLKSQNAAAAKEASSRATAKAEKEERKRASKARAAQDLYRAQEAAALQPSLVAARAATAEAAAALATLKEAEDEAREAARVGDARLTAAHAAVKTAENKLERAQVILASFEKAAPATPPDSSLLSPPCAEADTKEERADQETNEVDSKASAKTVSSSSAGRETKSEARAKSLGRASGAETSQGDSSRRVRFEEDGARKEIATAPGTSRTTAGNSQTEPSPEGAAVFKPELLGKESWLAAVLGSHGRSSHAAKFLATHLPSAVALALGGLTTIIASAPPTSVAATAAAASMDANAITSVGEVSQPREAKGVDDEMVAGGLRSAFLAADQALLSATSPGFEGPNDSSASCVVVCRLGARLYVAQCGNCRALLCQHSSSNGRTLRNDAWSTGIGGSGTCEGSSSCLGNRFEVGDSGGASGEVWVAQELRVNHAPSEPQERARIEERGGFVSANGRLNGEFPLSRAFGNPRLKCSSQQWEQHNSDQDGQDSNGSGKSTGDDEHYLEEGSHLWLLVAEPEVSSVACPDLTSDARNGGKSPETSSSSSAVASSPPFVVLGCSSFWSVCSPREACLAAVAALDQHRGDCHLASVVLARDAEDKLEASPGSISVQVVLLSTSSPFWRNGESSTPPPSQEELNGSPLRQASSLDELGDGMEPPESPSASNDKESAQSPGGGLFLRGAGRQLVLDDF